MVVRGRNCYKLICSDRRMSETAWRSQLYIFKKNILYKVIEKTRRIYVLLCKYMIFLRERHVEM